MVGEYGPMNFLYSEVLDSNTTSDWLNDEVKASSSSQWQLKELRELDNSVHELFIFKILTETFKNCTITYP